MKYLTIIALLITTGAYAGEHHNPPPKAVSQSQHQTQTAKANAEADASANSTNTNNATGGAGGSATANGGDAQATGGTSAASLVNEQPRQVPATAQGSFAIQGCGVAGNLGGANSHGAGFLGFGFTPSECYRFMLAQAYQAIGQSQTACEVLAHTDTAKAAVKDGLALPDCHPAAARIDPVAVPLPQDAVTHQELREVETRITDKAVKK